MTSNKLIKNNLSKSVIGSCFLAGLLEIYEFCLFGFLTPILYKNFLSFLDENTALLASYSLFATGFVFRPLGALIFGYIGDKYGRKTSLVLSVSLTGLASLSMCLLPSYDLIGVSACYIIVMIRIIQGISVGGEYSGAIIFAVEHFDNKKAGFVGSFIVSGCLCGVLLATLVSIIIKLPFMPDYAWRFAFLLGFALSIVGYFIRKKLGETPEFKSIQNNRIKIPLIQGFINRKIEFIVAIFISAATGVNLYYVVVFLPNYLKEVTAIDLWYLPIVTTLILAILSPFFGWLSDKVSRVKIITLGMGLVTVYSAMMLSLVGLNPTAMGICLVFIVHAILFSIQDGTMNTLIVEIFPPECRFSCSAFCYSIGMGVIGGTSPAVSALITNNFVEPSTMLSLYVGSVSFLGLCSMLILLFKYKERKNQNVN